VTTRRAGLTAEHGVQWESDGSGKYTIENIEKSDRGTEIVLHLKKEMEDFLDDWKIRNIITTYSDHIMIPILMKKSETPEWETVNRAKALWTINKSEIKDEDYKELYKHISHDFEDPLTWSHNRVEGKLEYTSLLYIPQRAPFDLWNREQQHGLKLYVKRVFIMDDVKQFLPMYLRFIKGIVDSNDLPLNISREILQDNDMIGKIKSALVKRVLSSLEDLVKNDPEKFNIFWKQFGKVLKEGPAEDFANREQIAKLLRFSSTHTDSNEQTVSFDDYISRMQKDQDKIYYVTADSFEAAKNSPHLEIFRKKGIEVLLLSDRVDEWLTSHLSDYDKKHLQSVAKGDLDLGKLEDKKEKEEQEQAEKDYDSMLKHIKEILNEKVKEVRLTHRLTTSPACIVADAYDMNISMQRILQSIGQEVPESKPIFELNPEHALIKRLKNESDDERFKEWVHILFDQSFLAEGGQLKDPATFVARLNKLLLELA
jgi:molecular chaperone HtpG